MSNMASEMAARMREDGLDPANDRISPTEPLETAAEPGTERTQPTPQPQPSAETLNAETSVGGEEPGPVPYSRFREVNEAYQNLRGYETLRQYGYDPDSLGRLAQFEAGWVQDPHGTVARMVDNLDLPDEAKNQISALLDAESEESPDGGGTPATPGGQSDEPPAWFKPYAERVQREDQAQIEARENAEREQRLNAVVSYWDQLDEADGISTPEGIKLSLIASYAGSGRYQTTEQLVQAARAERLAAREADLGSTVVPSRTGIGPRSVPRSAAVPAPPQKFRDMKEASKAAEAAIARGEIPPITPGG